MDGDLTKGIPGVGELFRGARALTVAEPAHLAGRLPSAPWALLAGRAGTGLESLLQGQTRKRDKDE